MNQIIALFKRLIVIFLKPKLPVPVLVPDKIEPTFTLPHPEEPMDSLANKENVNVEAVRLAWFVQWEVPEKHIDYWEKIGMNVVDKFREPYSNDPVYKDVPELTFDSAIEIKPPWVNPGVLAHANAHISFSLLSEFERSADFVLAYAKAKDEPLIKMMIERHPYALINDVELHAEIYRYLGQKMPEILKPFYPKLF